MKFANQIRTYVKVGFLTGYNVASDPRLQTWGF